MEKKNEVLEISISFAIDAIKFATILKQEKQFEIAQQLLKSATSIGANIHEAQHAESIADFIHKLKIASKEANETNYWLILCEKSEILPKAGDLQQKLNSIQKLLSKIISTSKNNQKSLNH